MAYIKGKTPLNEQGGLFRKNAMKYKKRAANGARTRDPQLGKLMLYQLSYCRVLLGCCGGKNRPSFGFLPKFARHFLTETEISGIS